MGTASAVVLSGLTAPAVGWTLRTELDIAEMGRRCAPPDLARQIAKHEPSFRQGVATAAADPDRRRHVQNPDGSGQLQAVIRVEVGAAADAIRRYQRFDDVVFRLGVIAHYVAAANDPLAVSDADARETRFAGDYGRYVDSAASRFAVVFYGREPLLERPSGLDLFVRATILRSRQLYPAVSREYGRIGYGSGVGRFDDRSTAFGVAALAYSHAVTDIGLVLRHLWLQSGGGDDRPQLVAAGQLFRVPRGR